MNDAGRFDTSHSLLEQLGEQADEEAWNRLHDLYAPLFQSWLARYDVQPADADDLIQDILLVVMRELPSFEHNHQSGAFRNWLRRILINRLRNFWRRRGRDVTGGSDLARKLSELEDGQSQLSRAWESEHNRHLTRRLMELCRPRFTDTTLLVFRRMAIDGAKGSEVAAEMNLSLSAVFNAKSRVVRELRRLGKGLID